MARCASYLGRIHVLWMGCYVHREYCNFKELSMWVFWNCLFVDELEKMDPATLGYFFGIVDGHDKDSLGVATNSLPTISSPDKFMDLVHQLFFNGKRRALSFLGDRASTGSSPSRMSLGSLSTLSDRDVSLESLGRLSGRELITLYRSRFFQIQ